MSCELRDRLGRIAELIESGDALERDLVLALLREVYYEVKFGNEPVRNDAADCEVVTEIAPDQKAAADNGAEEDAAPEDCVPEDCIPEEQTPSDQIAELPVIPRPVAPEVIRSLYGSEGESEPKPEPKPESRPESEPSPTLGDAISSPRTLGESLRSNVPERDMAAHIAAAQAARRPGLKRSIGLNDRFLMIRDMFDGDADAFDRAITRLDAFTDLDEAVIWIHDNFDWSADNPGATLLVGLLERKLSGR